MGTLKYIINKLLLIELRTSNGANCIKVWKVSCKSNEISFTEQPFCDGKNIDKWKHFPAILLITGEQIVEKRLKSTDASIQKITENPELLWSLYPHGDSEEQTISFLRKELTEELVGSLEKSHIYVLKKWISRDEHLDRKQMIIDFYKRLKISDIRKNTMLLNLLSLVIYYKLRLPLLLCCFIVLLGNFLLNTRIRKEYEAAQNELYLNQQKNERQLANQKKQGRIQTQYQSVPNRSFALIADRIASYVPPQIVLNSLIISPPEGAGKNDVLRNKEVKFNTNSILIKGETEIPGGVTLFTQYLGCDQLFSSTKIYSLTREKDYSLFTFELNLELKP